MRRQGDSDTQEEPREANEGLSLRRFLRRLPSQSRSRAAVEALITAFDDLLQKRGVEEVSLDAVASRAGVGIGSLYEYFANRDALLGGLIEKATRKNFDDLVARMDAAGGSLDARTQVMAVATAETYLRHPARTRVLAGGIMRLGLVRIVVLERDRFARELAGRAHRHYPEVALVDLELSMCRACDAVMGIVHGHLYRGTPIDVPVVADELRCLVVALLRDRHGEPV